MTPNFLFVYLAITSQCGVLRKEYIEKHKYRSRKNNSVVKNKNFIIKEHTSENVQE
jgi:hypothetical protein